jgi:hypothetical protein
VRSKLLLLGNGTTRLRQQHQMDSDILHLSPIANSKNVSACCANPTAIANRV